MTRAPDRIADLYRQLSPPGPHFQHVSWVEGDHFLEGRINAALTVDELGPDAHAGLKTALIGIFRTHRSGIGEPMIV